jgi:predicted alpha/beta superfamily hydrolase
MKNFKKPASIAARDKRPILLCKAFNQSLCLLLLLIQQHGYGQENAPLVQKKVIASKILGEDRTIQVYTPTNFKKDEAYPVVYLLDGEAQTTMVAGQVQYLSEIYKVLPNLIVVGIENTDRVRDLTPTHFNVGPDGKEDTSARAMGRTSGGGERFLQFIRQELMPYVESNYPVAPFRILSGHSLGGLMAIYCLANHPDYFNGYIAISPSLQWDRNSLLEQLPGKLAASYQKRFLFFSDASEGSAFHSNQLKMDSLLLAKKAGGLQVKYAYYPEESHVSEPVKAFYDGIRFIYPDWHLPYNNSAFKQKMSAALVKAQFEKLSAIYGYRVIPPQDDINAIGRFLRNDPARIKDALELLEMNAANYPRSVKLWELLGDTYLKAGDLAKSLSSFEKGLALDPGNESLQKKRQSLRN